MCVYIYDVGRINTYIDWNLEYKLWRKAKYNSSKNMFLLILLKTFSLGGL